MLGKALLEHCERNKSVDIRWNARVSSVGSNEKGAWAVVQEKDGSETRYTADYLCGCDGANSQVRRSLLGSKFPGKTWDAQIVATNVCLSPPVGPVYWLMKTGLLPL
jgi:2-polyprenyl-6-methoxyphenol hydroxylase-like FAD-dependent oxidoreductase